jgi:hypothetical protein
MLHMCKIIIKTLILQYHVILLFCYFITSYANSMTLIFLVGLSNKGYFTQLKLIQAAQHMVSYIV